MRDTQGVIPVVVAGVVILLVTSLQLGARLRRSPQPAEVPSESHAADLVAAAVCVGLAVLAAALHGSSGDDVYYVNRATWVAERGTPTLRDTVFSPGELPTGYGGGFPLPSIEAWQGAVAHVLGLQAPEFVFVWTVPVLAAGAGWATWRLVRTWAPRRAGLVLLVATAFTLFSATGVVGRYDIGAIWEGKVAAVAVVIPLAWHHLTMLALRPRRAHLLALLALGTCFAGLTSSAALMAPVMAAAALLGAVLLRSRACAAGAGCFVLTPLLTGVASAFGPAVGGAAPTALPPGQVFGYLFGMDAAMVGLGVVGTVLGPRTMRGPAAVVAACASLAGLASLLPGVGDMVNGATGAGPVAWRMVFSIPVAVLVGMLVTVRPPPVPIVVRHLMTWDRLTGLAACAVVAAVVAQGTPLWSARMGVTLDPGAWKVDLAALDDVRAVSKVRTPPGLWLLPPTQMGVLAMTTTAHFAVVPRALYLTGLHTTQVGLTDRTVLYRLVSGHAVPPESVRLALHRLQVSLACVPAADSRAGRLLARAVRAPLEPHGSMLCHVGDPAAG
jgi:hypothetical protein